VIFYILLSLSLEFISSALRSFFSPLILVASDFNSPIVKFTDRYRLLLYSVCDFMVGLALLYLFYTQSMMAVQRDQRNKRAVLSFDRYKDLGDKGGGGNLST
jgi:hypothetical protein